MTEKSRDRIVVAAAQFRKAAHIAVTGLVVAVDAARLAAVEVSGKISEHLARIRKG
jgi:hypothetical protein